MHVKLLIISLFFTLEVAAQVKSVTYFNSGEAIRTEVGTFYSNKIHEITLSSDTTFEFWSRPGLSCILWRNFKGIWKKDKDTVYFSDEYQISQDDVTATYQNSEQRSFFIDFRTDEGDQLNNKKVQITYIYDYDSKLSDVSGEFTLTANNTLEIPFNDIPKYHDLASSGQLIAPLILIPFVENAFKHGLSGGAGWITININVVDNLLFMNVENSYLPGAVRSEGGIGLENVRKRLALIYPDKHQLEVVANQEVFEVDLKIEL